MKFRLLIAVIVFPLSMFCGLVIVADGMLAGKYETLFPYVADTVCGAGEELTLEQELNTTGGLTYIDGIPYEGLGYTQNTLYCVNAASGEKREVTNDTYNAVEKLRKQIGWWVTIGLFLVTMLIFLIFQPALLRRFDRIIGYKPPEQK